MKIEESNPTPPRSESEAFRPSRPRRRSGEGSGSGRGEGDQRPPRSEGGSSSSSEGRPPRRREGGSGGGRSGDDRRGPRGPRSEGGPSARRGGGERPPRGPKPEPKQKTETASADSGDASAEAPTAELLASVSRSFSLTINLLPAELRAPITTGYLLARALDTVADSASMPAAKRLTHLRALLEMIKYGADPELLRPLQKEVGAKQEHLGERALIKELGGCLAALENSPPVDRWELRRTLARIGRGQELDIQRFGDPSAEAKPLATAAELDEYTYFVAGCVGELWTRLCREHLPEGWSKRSEADMLALGKRFGQGLQMVNILRDLPADLAVGRCYLPADLLAKHGLDAASLKSDPAKARPLLAELYAVTLGHLDAAWEYVSALNGKKLRHAVALPVLIGLETLTLLKKNPALETVERVKMPRAVLRRLMASAALGAVLPGWLNGLHGRLRRRAGG